MSEDTQNALWYRRAFGYVDLRDIPWVGFGWIGFVAVIFSSLILLLSPEYFAVWISTFGATFLSIISGVVLYRHQGNRREFENLYRLHMVLDADLESLLFRIDPSKDESMKPLKIQLPSGAIASAYVSSEEGREPMFEEVARTGMLQSRRQTLFFFILAGAIREYRQACANFLALYRDASVASGVGLNTEQALLREARLVEKRREGLVRECTRIRTGLAKWLESNKGANPWGPENAEDSPQWRDVLTSAEQSEPEHLESSNTNNSEKKVSR